jgi:cobalt-zinc-cadmium efflux system outer membrane protein
MVIPDVTISAQYERNPPSAPNSAGVGLTFPLPIWNRNGGAIRAARAARDLAQAQLDKTRTAALAEIASARSAYQTAIAQADVYAHELGAKSAGVVKTVAFAYERGGAALVELLAAERNANDIRLSAVRAQADAASAAFALTAALNLIEPAAMAATQP